MAIYLVDYENVYIDGLQGLCDLTEEDTVHIFYTQNRCGLTFGLYEQLISCRADVHLNEVAMSLKTGDLVKNALDIQLMMFLGYLIGTRKTPQLYVVSKDKDFQLGGEFFERFIHDDSITLQIIPDIRYSLVPPEETAQESACPVSGDPAAPAEPIQSFAMLCNQYAAETELPCVPAEEAEEAPMFTVQYYNTVRNLLGRNTDEETVSHICEIISDTDNLVDFNNALSRYYRDSAYVKGVYHKFKPRFEDLRHLSRTGKKSR